MQDNIIKTKTPIETFVCGQKRVIGYVETVVEPVQIQLPPPPVPCGGCCNGYPYPPVPFQPFPLPYPPYPYPCGQSCGCGQGCGCGHAQFTPNVLHANGIAQI